MTLPSGRRPWRIVLPTRRPCATRAASWALQQDPTAWFEQATREHEDTARILGLVEARLVARSARDFATADRIRDELAALGITVEDRADGSGWRRTG